MGKLLYQVSPFDPMTFGIRLRSHDCDCDDGLFLACLARYSNRSGERFAKLVFKAPRNKNCGGNCKESTPAPTPVDGI
jgi:hypothetical protein